MKIALLHIIIKKDTPCAYGDNPRPYITLGHAVKIAEEQASLGFWGTYIHDIGEKGAFKMKKLEWAVALSVIAVLISIATLIITLIGR